MAKPGMSATSALLTTTRVEAVKQDMDLLLQGRHHDPFQVLGRHWLDENTWIIRVLLPDATSVWIEEKFSRSENMIRIENTDVFELLGNTPLQDHYTVAWQDHGGNTHRHVDPYIFPPVFSDLDLYLFGEGMHLNIYQKMGAHPMTFSDVEGVFFAVWAPNAERVSVVGDFNQWDGRRHPMRCRGQSGVWELFIPGVESQHCYKYEIRGRDDGKLFVKADPYANFAELRPATASRITPHSTYQWQDHQWMEQRKQWDWQHQPVSIYEVHPGSWRRHDGHAFLTWRELAHELIPYVASMGFTHIQLMPIAEHPLDASWGYQCTGYYAPTSRFGDPYDFRYFIDACHQHNLGVLIDWVAGHFPKDPHGLSEFDGSALYEHADPRQGEHRDWGTLIFNYGRHEVKNFLLANAIYWLTEFHIDGLRVDAVASILYLDYSREEGDWIANKYGGNENLEAIDFLRVLNEQVHRMFPGVVVIAEESTAWPQVSRPTYTGGVGFSMKWNMGWMNDTLSYFSNDPIYRRYHHQQLTFAMLYAYHENFVLALSHDEVVHGKKSLLEKMPGDDWQKFANLRLLYTYQFSWPGKKLLFMGGEFAQRSEWDSNSSLQWDLYHYVPHQGMSALVTDLNHLYQKFPALYGHDFDQGGFEWIDCNDVQQSVLSYMRKSGEQRAIVVLNFTPVPRYQYRIGVPLHEDYVEVFNSDSAFYGGTNIGNNGCVTADAIPVMNKPFSLSLTLPPLAGVILLPSKQFNHNEEVNDGKQ